MKKVFYLVLILALIFTSFACGSEVVESENSDTFIEVIAEGESVDSNAGITLLLDDGTVIHDGESALKIANSTGAVVRYNGEPVRDYRCDVNGYGAINTNSDYGWFSCETDSTEKLFVWILDSVDYRLSVEYNGEIAEFDIDAANNYMYNITLGGPKPIPGASTSSAYFMGFGTIIGSMPVYYQGKRVSDYDFVLRDQYGTMTKGTDGKLHFSSNVDGETVLTVTINGEARSYYYHAQGNNLPGANRFKNVKSIPPRMLKKKAVYLDRYIEVAGTPEQQGRYHLLADSIINYGFPDESKGFTITWDDALNLVGQDLESVKQKVASVEDCMLYLTAAGYKRNNGDLSYKAKQTDWHFNYAPSVVFAKNEGNCGGTAGLVCYLLQGDYDELGCIGMTAKDHNGHVINYVKDGNNYYAFDMSQFASNCAYGMNLHTGSNFAEVAKEAVNGYNTYVMACYNSAYDDSYIYGDIPCGFGSGNESYWPTNFGAEVKILFDDESNGYTYKPAELSSKDLEKIINAKTLANQ